MDQVFDAQYHNIHSACTRRNIHIQIAYLPNGTVDYIYQVGRLLVRDDNQVTRLLEQELPGIARVDPAAEPVPEGLVLWSIENLKRGHTEVPEALAILDGRVAPSDSRPPVVSANNVLHITIRLCTPSEPEMPSAETTAPSPPVRTQEEARRDVQVGICDTGLLAGVTPAAYPWMTRVDGEVDELGPMLANGRYRIPEYKGHGTFVAGVLKCMAPAAGVYVSNPFSWSGAELESSVILRLDQLAERTPEIINLSAGMYTRNDWPSLGFDVFHERHPDLTLVVSAGNDGTDRPFYPAWCDWAIGVGAIGADQKQRAWFSNFGAGVNVYALGEGLVNAFATGEYVYQEPPKRPGTQVFDGLARWSGTSFSTPLVTGLIAARMAANPGEPAKAAAEAVLAAAEDVAGVGPVLRP